ncbi:MAG: hypothetical protein AAF734_06800, partial [Bacteroidota bacterium]
RSFFSFAELHFVPVLDEPRQELDAVNRASGELGAAKSRNRACELDEVKSKASAHKPAHLPAGFSGLHTYTDLKNRKLGKI